MHEHIEVSYINKDKSSYYTIFEQEKLLKISNIPSPIIKMKNLQEILDFAGHGLTIHVPSILLLGNDFKEMYQVMLALIEADIRIMCHESKILYKKNATIHIQNASEWLEVNKYIIEEMKNITGNSRYNIQKINEMQLYLKNIKSDSINKKNEYIKENNCYMSDIIH